ncbi:WD40 repeat domain-containing protein [Uniformispora flossi]|uniref:WD40 repeat domain-containing protein n=1 Tax=Uniformispora flossi TaxID=3390723 RepID=UPI003C3087F2
MAAMATRATRPAPEWERQVDDVPAALAVSGGLCVVACARGGVHLLDVVTGQAIAKLWLPGGAHRVGFSPDGAVAAVAGPCGYALWRVADGAVLMRATDAPARFAWADANLCAVAYGGAVVVYDAASGVERWRPLDGAVPVDDLAWFDRGRTVAAAVGGDVYAYSARGRVAAWSYPAPVRVLAGGTDGAWLCAAGDGPGVFIRGVGGTSEDLPTPGPALIDGLALDGSGQWLAAQSDGGLTVWDLAARGGRMRPKPRRLEASIGLGVAAWRPAARGAVIATGGGDGAVAVWDARAGSVRRAASPSVRWYAGAPVTALAWAGSEVLVYADAAGRVTARAPE